MEIDHAVLEILKHDIAAILGNRRADTRIEQFLDLGDNLVVFRRGRIVANLMKDETSGQDVVAYITGAKTGTEYADAA